jgi:hypothetical protein
LAHVGVHVDRLLQIDREELRERKPMEKEMAFSKMSSKTHSAVRRSAASGAWSIAL